MKQSLLKSIRPDPIMPKSLLLAAVNILEYLGGGENFLNTQNEISTEFIITIVVVVMIPYICTMIYIVPNGKEVEGFET